MNRIPWNRTKIVATLGPATDSRNAVRQLIMGGVDVIRLNFSHGTKQEHCERIQMVRSASKQVGRPVAILADLPGPKIRVGSLRKPKELTKGKEIILTTKLSHVNKEEISVSYPNLPDEVNCGETIYLDDGALKLKVLEKKKYSIRCKIVIGGSLKSEAGINLPGVTLKTGFLTRSDRDLIVFAIKQEIDLLALSFVRKSEDIKQVRDILKKKGKDIFIISKIEKHEVIKNIDNVIKASDGIMVARGDLGVELPIEKVALIQKTIIEKCNKIGKPVITATQMLESMIYNQRPTRAEVTDITNAILDGTDAVMLSGETAVGKYPIESVKTIVRIANHVENSLDYGRILSERHAESRDSITDMMSFSACESALYLKAKAIVTPTRSGMTARMVSRYRPKAMIVAPTPHISILRRLCLSWGVYPLLLPEKRRDKSILPAIYSFLKKEIPLWKKDRVIITGGNLKQDNSHTNFVRVEVV